MNPRKIVMLVNSRPGQSGEFLRSGLSNQELALKQSLSVDYKPDRARACHSRDRGSARNKQPCFATYDVDGTNWALNRTDPSGLVTEIEWLYT